ncbi:1,3,7-trimethyluric acid N-methyltransferase CkTcS-like [Silene latifolia]|uniref:1,3,7-trimethyluric acid N-methyltransferase CkTcS-like n=1 Tax=Silene latifolia TaxID=37657 RepID=UPI003D77A489
METKNILHMTIGDGEFSYAHNSNSQNRAFSCVIKPLLEASVRSVLYDMKPCKVLNVADLGCGVGPTPISVISTLLKTVNKICSELKFDDEEVPQVQIFMSDLPSNDFNLLFREVGKIQNGKPSCFVMGAPGSFHGRLFPCNSLQLVLSNYAIHWLSQVPKGLSDEKGTQMNKGKIVASETSQPEALKAYYDQFQQDFTNFLNCRSNEVVPNGYMVLATLCRPSTKPMETRLLKFLYQALARLVYKGVIKQEKLDSFNLPVYFPCKEEIHEFVLKQGSFAIEHLEVTYDEVQNQVKDFTSGAEFLAKVARSISEALISYHFGDDIWDELYDAIYQVILKHLKLGTYPSDIFNIVIVLRKMAD